MRYKQIVLLSTILMGMILVTAVPSGLGFDEPPTLTDPYGDPTIGDDIIKVWIDNNATYIMFQIEFNSTFLIDSATGDYFYVYISTNNLTGTNVAGAGFNVDYYLWMRYTGVLDFYDVVNSSNDLLSSNLVGSGYYISSNNNYTLELGYKINHYSPSGTGYLNLTLGQTIEIRFRSDQTSDWCPDNDSFSYIIEIDSAESAIPGYNLIFLLSILSVVAIFLGKKLKKS
ncbi:hypothetical protein LCGC14_0953470 [marine sediment metagenome]|uniref:Uncharacterized protein n=1 Tax=marine sediment metagenome TaxID=412755 RepID=A0A0F9NL58_9ZZZZ